MSIANSLELGMLALINGARGAAGLEPLRLITLLNQAAETHSAWMLRADDFGHDGEDDTTPADRMAAAGYPFEGVSLALENIGWQNARGEADHEDDVAQIHDSLISSPGHRANILNPDAQDVGIGIEIGTFTGDNGDYEAVMVTQVFGATEADVSAWVDPGTADESEMPDDDMIEDETPDDDEMDAPVDDDPTADELLAENDGGGDQKEGTGNDIVTEDDPQNDDDPAEGDDPADDMGEDDPPLPEMPEMPLPCGLENFTVDLSSAFAFRKDGDQLIWETSEDKLIETFLAAFEEWAGVPEESDGDVIDVMAEDGDTSLGDLLSEDMPRLPVEPQPAEDPDQQSDWDFVTCA